MHTKKQHIVRKTIIVSVSFILGIVSTVIAAATYDANIQTRATKMFNTIKSNASTLATADQQAYYTLVRLNIESLIQVLMSVNSSLDIELGTISELNDSSVLSQITTGSSSTNQGNSNSTTTLSSTTSNNSITVTVNSGILYCGDPSKNDYTTYSPVDKKVIIQKSYCNEKGGKIWIKCNGENTNIKSVDSFQGGEVLSCPSTSVQAPGTATSVSSSVQTSTSVNGCNWQYHSVVGPVGALTVNPSTTACTPNTNGTKAVEVTGNRQTVATCNCTTANSATPTPGTVASVKQVTLTVPSGMIACGNPDKNDYTTYSTVDGKVIIQKDYCITKGGYIWVMCGGKATNIKNVDTIQDGITFSCPTVSNTTTTSPSCAGIAPVGEGVIKSTSVVGMVGSDTWNYVTNTKGTSTDLGQSCQWTCAPGYTRLENKCVNGASVSSLNISPTSGVFNMTDKNTITATVTGLTKENTLVCNEVLAHPAYPSAISPAGYCSNPANFVPFSGNEDWTYMDGRWIGNVKYNAAIYGAAGIKVRGYWKNKSTGAIVTYDLSVIAGSNNTTTGVSSNQEYRWSCIVPGPVVVDTSNYSCNSSNVGKSQTIGGYSCNCTGPTPTPGTVASLKQVTLTVPSGMVACGNPDKNDYTTYSTVDGKVIIQKDYCISKGGYVWVMCGGKATNIKNVDTVQDGTTFSCPTVSSTSTATNSCNWQYHSVVGPVGEMTVNPSTTACTLNTNGTKAVEISGNKQTVATCTCSVAATSGMTSSTSNLAQTSVVTNSSQSNSTTSSSAAQVSINVSGLDWGTIDGGIIPMSIGKTYTAETKKIVIKNTETPYDPKNINQQGQSIKIAKNISVKSNSPVLEIDNNCENLELKPTESCVIYVTFVAGRNNIDYLNGEIVIDGNFKSLANGSSKISIPLSGKVNGFCQGVGYSYNGQLTSKPDGLCKTVELQPGCYASKAFGVVKVLPVCINTIPSSSTIGTWIGNSASPQAALKSESKSNICYMGDGGSLYANANPRQWDVYNCSRKWAVPELANDTSLESTSTSSSTVSSPEFINSRQDTDSGQYHAWSTKNVDRLSWSCTGPAGKTYGNDSEVLNHERYFSSWTSLHQDGWPAGSYTCTWRYSGNGITKSFTEYFTLK